MSLDLVFLLILLVKMAVTAAFVVSASMITERAGPAIGALVTTLPVSAGPAYVFLALDHDAAFIAQAALTSLPINAATVVFACIYVLLAQRGGVVVSLAASLACWVILAALVRLIPWSLAGAVAVNAMAFLLCLPLVRRFRTARMPPVARRWYDVPLRAAIVAVVVATLVISASRVGPAVSGIIALFPAVFTSMILILHPRIGGRANAAVIANGLWGLIGFGVAIVVLHAAAVPLGSAAALTLALATSVGWNFSLWLLRRRRARTTPVSRPSSPP